MTDFNIYDIQKKIGYEFNNPTLLKQAFTSPSITEATQHKIKNYQVLEFIGDSVLALAVVKNLAHEFCSLDNDGQMVCKTTEGKLTVRKQELIKNKTLAHCSKLLGLNQYINKAYEYSSADYKNKKGDLVEAILGAVAFDSNWNMEILSSVIRNIIKYKDFDINYTEKLEAICRKNRMEEPIYRFNQNKDIYECYVSVSNADRIFKGQASTEIDAQNNACKDACNYFTKPINIKPFDANINAICNLNLMYQAKKIEKPEYEFEQLSVMQGFRWKCFASMAGVEYKFCSEGSTKQDAKRIAAAALLNYLTGTKYEYIERDPTYVIRGKGLLKLIMSKYFPIEKIAV